MKKVIWKYKLRAVEKQCLAIPKGAEILSVQLQGNNACLWALVNPEEEKEIKTIGIFKTGNPIATDRQCKFIDTIQLYNGELVFHVFELI